jgi:Ca2+-binding EF-hand superfamily protein
MFKAIVAGVLMIACGGAMAQMRHSQGELFEQADANNDGSISRDEFRNSRAAKFSKRDQNSDGYLDAADLPQRAASRPRMSEAFTAMLKQFDSNGDGKVTKEEFVDGAMPMFDKADSDHNGILDAKELESAKAAVKARVDEMRNR